MLTSIFRKMTIYFGEAKMGNLLFLYGPPGSGKTEMAEKLAEKIGFQHFDLDEVIIKKEKSSIVVLIENVGLEFFRDIETATLKELVENCNAENANSVIALGGGTLLEDRNRQLCEKNGKIIFLDVEVTQLIERLRNDEDKRPLLTGDLNDRLTQLLIQRKKHYESFKIRTSNNNNAELDLILDVINNSKIFKLTGMGLEYEVIIYSRSRFFIKEFVGTLTDRKTLGIIFDENTAKYYQEEVENSFFKSGFSIKTLILPAGEKNKNLSAIQKLWEFFLDCGFDRRSTVIAFGGGVVNDLVGFAASTFLRGIQWISIPTTLLAMVDASIGGKTGFDLEYGKNLVGSFYPPRMVIVDPDLLKTLPNEEFKSGMAEVLKHGVIADKVLFNDVAKGLYYVKREITSVIIRAVTVKIGFIEQDPYENGVRAALNFGHTVGHAIEIESGFKLRHGEAIGIGMVIESLAGEKLGITENGTNEKIVRALTKLGLPVVYPDNISKENILRFMWNDKKKNDKVIRFALPVEIGKVRTGIEISDLESIL